MNRLPAGFCRRAWNVPVDVPRSFFGDPFGTSFRRRAGPFSKSFRTVLSRVDDVRPRPVDRRVMSPTECRPPADGRRPGIFRSFRTGPLVTVRPRSGLYSPRFKTEFRIGCYVSTGRSRKGFRFSCGAHSSYVYDVLSHQKLVFLRP